MMSSLLRRCSGMGRVEPRLALPQAMRYASSRSSIQITANTTTNNSRSTNNTIVLPLYSRKPPNGASNQPKMTKKLNVEHVMEQVNALLGATVNATTGSDSAAAVMIRDAMQRGAFTAAANTTYSFSYWNTTTGAEAGTGTPRVLVLVGMGGGAGVGSAGAGAEALTDEAFAIGRAIGKIKKAEIEAADADADTDTDTDTDTGSSLSSSVSPAVLPSIDLLLPHHLLTTVNDDRKSLQQLVRQLHLGASDAMYTDQRFKRGGAGVGTTATTPLPSLLSCTTIRIYNLSLPTTSTSTCTSTSTSTSSRPQDQMETWVANAAAEADGVHWARDQVNAPSNTKTPLQLAQYCSSFASELGLQCRVLGASECEAEGMGAFLGVQQGSRYEPQLVHLTYTPPAAAADAASPPTPPRVVALVGKGLTFDSGGYNLKVGAGSQIELMKMDMGGAAAVFGAAKAIAQLQPDGVEVHFISALCENMVSRDAMRPGDVLVASNGKTIEVINTDAEGRLTLADALVYASRIGTGIGASGSGRRADVIVDLATLTGACIVGLGDRISALYTDNDRLADQLVAAAKNSNEKLWRMPLEDEYTEQIKGGPCDVKNLGVGGRGGGSITAALFLKEFVGAEARMTRRTAVVTGGNTTTTPAAPPVTGSDGDGDGDVAWAHIDMAGPVWDSASGQATGWGVKMLTQFVLDQQKHQQK